MINDRAARDSPNPPGSAPAPGPGRATGDVGGQGKRFEVRIAFSEPIANSFRHVDDAASAEGARIGGAVRVNGRSDL